MSVEIFPIIRLGAGSLSAMAKPTARPMAESPVKPSVESEKHTDMGAVFKSIGASGITRIVSLLTESDAEKAGLSEEGSFAERHGMEFMRFPISDFGVPTSLPEYCAFVRQQYDDIANGQRIVVHCYAGIGRTGIVTSSILMHHGYSPMDAFKLVSEKRGSKVPDTQAQIEWVCRNQSAIIGH